MTPYSAGSDHDDYDSSTVAVPSLYLRDWPDIYIHTDHDTLQQIDPTKLRRVALLGAAAGYVYATLDAERSRDLLPFYVSQSEIRLAQLFQHAQQVVDGPETGCGCGMVRGTQPDAPGSAPRGRDAVVTAEVCRLRHGCIQPRRKYSPIRYHNFNSWIDSQAQARGAKGAEPKAPWAGDAAAQKIPLRVGEFGPLNYQNDDVLKARLAPERMAKIKLLNSEATPLLNVQDLSELYAYEIVNFVDGKRTVGEIRDAVAAEYGPLPVQLVSDYLEACREAGVIQWK